ncbi:unnamed protein product, partial [Allacma fusca]
MSKRFRRAFRDKLCRNPSCCLCLCCSEVVIIGGVSASAGGGGPARVRVDSQSTTTRHRLLTYRNNLNIASSLHRPVREVSYGPEEQVVAENLSNSETERGKTYTFPRGQKKFATTKKSHSLPDSSLCGLQNGNITQQPNNHSGQLPTGALIKSTRDHGNRSAEWLLKKRFCSKSDGATPSNAESEDQPNDPLHGDTSTRLLVTSKSGENICPKTQTPLSDSLSESHCHSSAGYQTPIEDDEAFNADDIQAVNSSETTLDLSSKVTANVAI